MCGVRQSPPAYPWKTAGQLRYQSCLVIDPVSICHVWYKVPIGSYIILKISISDTATSQQLHKPLCRFPMYHSMLNALEIVVNIYKFIGQNLSIMLQPLCLCRINKDHRWAHCCSQPRGTKSKYQRLRQCSTALSRHCKQPTDQIDPRDSILSAIMNWPWCAVAVSSERCFYCCELLSAWQYL